VNTGVPVSFPYLILSVALLFYLIALGLPLAPFTSHTFHLYRFTSLLFHCSFLLFCHALLRTAFLSVVTRSSLHIFLSCAACLLSFHSHSSLHYLSHSLSFPLFSSHSLSVLLFYPLFRVQHDSSYCLSDLAILLFFSYIRSIAYSVISNLISLSINALTALSLCSLLFSHRSSIWQLRPPVYLRTSRH